MSTPDKAVDYLTVCEAAVSWRNGERFYARVLIDSLADPIGDLLQISGVMLAVISHAEKGLSHDARTD